MVGAAVRPSSGKQQVGPATRTEIPRPITTRHGDTICWAARFTVGDEGVILTGFQVGSVAAPVRNFLNSQGLTEKPQLCKQYKNRPLSSCSFKASPTRSCLKQHASMLCYANSLLVSYEAEMIVAQGCSWFFLVPRGIIVITLLPQCCRNFLPDPPVV